MEALKKLLYSFNFQDGGLLFYRLVFGLSIMTHGILKFSGGAKGLYGVGHNLAQFGVGGGYLELGIIAICLSGSGRYSHYPWFRQRVLVRLW